MAAINLNTSFTYTARVSTAATTTITFGVTGLGENLSESALGELALADVSLYAIKKFEVESVDARYNDDEEFIVKVQSVPVS